MITCEIRVKHTISPDRSDAYAVSVEMQNDGRDEQRVLLAVQGAIRIVHAISPPDGGLSPEVAQVRFRLNSTGGE